MSEELTMILAIAVVLMTSSILLSKLLGLVKEKIKKRQVQIQEKQERRVLYLKLLKIKNSRRRWGRKGPNR